MKKKVLKITGITLLVLLAIIIALPLFLQGKIEEIIKTKVNNSINATLDFEDLEFRSAYSAQNAYRRSKLCNIMFTRALARRLEGSRITTNALHPGFVRTAFGGAGNPLYFRLAVRAAMLTMGIGVEEGARTSIYLASSPQVEGVSGKYFAKSAETTPTKAARDDEAGERLWQISEQMVSNASA